MWRAPEWYEAIFWNAAERRPRRFTRWWLRPDELASVIWYRGLQVVVCTRKGHRFDPADRDPFGQLCCLRCWTGPLDTQGRKLDEPW